MHVWMEPPAPLLTIINDNCSVNRETDDQIKVVFFAMHLRRVFRTVAKQTLSKRHSLATRLKVVVLSFGNNNC